MHVFYASGGLFQYSLNQIFRTFRGAHARMTYEAMMELMRQVHTSPQADGDLSRMTLAKRIVTGQADKRDAEHMRCFSSDILELLPRALSLVSLIPGLADKFPEHARYLDLAYNISFLLMLGERAVPHAGLLDTLLQAHHDLYCELFAECIIPKTHYATHLGAMMASFGANFNCFTPERLHKLSKRIAVHCYNSLGKSMLIRLLVAGLLHAKNEDSWLRPYAVLKVYKLKQKRFQAFFDEGGLRIRVYGGGLRTPTGSYAVKEFVVWKDQGSLRGGLAKGFAMCETRIGEIEPIIVVDEHACAEEAETSLTFRRPARVNLLHASKCLCKLPYIENGADGYRVMKPRLLHQVMS